MEEADKKILASFAFVSNVNKDMVMNVKVNQSTCDIVCSFSNGIVF